MTGEGAAVQGIGPGALLDFATEIYLRSGLRTADARLAADSLVQADLWGHQSHGVMRLPWYVARLRAGVVSSEPAPEVEGKVALLTLDGGARMGPVVASVAMRAAIARAKTFGLAAVSVRNSNHFGVNMYFSLMAAAEGCIGFVATNSSPAMPPWGGRAKTVGANPWSWAAPAGRFAPMVLDISNTGVARGKIYLARQKGAPIPLGWALDEHGAPTTDPVAALRGVTLPMAEHKGYGAAVLMDMLSGVLSGGAFGVDVNGPYQAEKPGDVGHLVIALDIAAVQPLDAFEARMEQLIGQLKASELAVGAEEIFYPGEIEARNDRRHRAEGLTLPADTCADLRRLAEELGCVHRPPFA
jgi:LDH2 family malate/lactate/ureidoglycolate dehydrogenase